jgi:hypothetical protein
MARDELHAQVDDQRAHRGERREAERGVDQHGAAVGAEAVENGGAGHHRPGVRGDTGAP